MTSKNVQIGPNSCYFGNKKDMALLMTQAPQEMPEANSRRSMLAGLIRPTRQQVKSLGLAGVAGTLLIKSLQEIEKA